MYAFHKWYFDVWNPPAEHCLCYLCDVDLGGFRRCLLGVARSHPGGQAAERRQYLLGARTQPSPDRGIVTDQGHVSIESRRVRAEFEVPGCRIQLEYESPPAKPCPPLVISGPRGRSVRWCPLAPQAPVRGRVRLGDWTLRFDGASGYADYLFSDLLPRRVPVRHLRWGRLHHPELVLAYTVARGRSPAEQWSRVLVEAGGMRHVMGDAELAGEDPTTYSFEARGDLLRVRATVRRTALAHEEHFLDNALLRWFANHPRGRKFFSRATLELETSAGRLCLDDAPVFDEEVVFGGAP